ncbi:unnamed protein product, partial [Cyprideis torosa]
DETPCSLSSAASSVVSRCTEHVVKQVLIHWRIPDLEAEGVACLTGIPLDESLALLMLQSPMDWDVRCGGVPWLPSVSEVTVRLGEAVPLAVSLAARSKPLHDLLFQISVLEESSSKCSLDYWSSTGQISRPEMKRTAVVIGASVTPIPK